MKIKADETKIVGHWSFEGSKMVANDECHRIDWLTKSCLIKVKTDVSGWLTLYKDQSSGRYWELMYPNSEMQGGGPPALMLLSDLEAKNKYGI